MPGNLHMLRVIVFQCVLGVADAKLAGVIQDSLEVSCRSEVVVAEISRGLRMYFPRLVKGMTAPNAAKAQLGGWPPFVVL